jgi:4-hydroxybenzoate polyprenyltransferase
MKLLKFILKLSRPRFWLYLGGTYLVGYAAGITTYHEFLRPTFWVHFLFFLIPANIFLYGINDYYDEDTDQFNTKKQTHEQLLVSQDKNSKASKSIRAKLLDCHNIRSAKSPAQIHKIIFNFFLS